MFLRTRFAVAAILSSIVLFSNVCGAKAQQPTLTVDQTKVVSTVSGIFDAATRDDLGKFHSVVAPGFYLFDGGARFDGDAIMTLMKAEHVRGRRYEWNVTEPDVHIIGDTAWIAYVNRGRVTDTAGSSTEQRWLESGFLVRDGKGWKIVFMHSTRVPPAPTASVAVKEQHGTK